MTRNDSALTVGQVFASRWFCRKYAEYRDRENPKREPEDTFEDIADAVDKYVEAKTEEFRTRLRALATKTADGEEGDGEVRFSSLEMLEHSAMKEVAQRWRIKMSPLPKFPV